MHPTTQLIDYQVGLIQDETEEGEAVLTVPDLAMLNFLAERPMPSRFYNLYQHHIAHDRGAEVVAASNANDVKLALTRYDDFFSDRIGMREYASDLTDYLLISTSTKTKAY